MDTGSETLPDRPPVSHRKRIVGTCEVCGAPFERYANGVKEVRRFCSGAHRMQAYYRARREPRPVETACLRCGKPVLQGSLGRIRRYCSQSCRQMAWVARRRQQSQETPASATM